MSVELDIAVNIIGTYAGSNDLASVVASIDKRNKMRLSAGAGANQANKLFADTRTVAGSANDDLDLFGSLVDPLGATLSFASIKAIYIRAADANVNELSIGPASSNGFLGPWADASDRVKLKAGELFLITNRAETGWAVTASTGDLLRVTNTGSGDVSYDIILIGD